MQVLITALLNFIPTHSDEYARVFHGRGGCFKGLENVVVDSFGDVVKLSFYDHVVNEQEIIDHIHQYSNSNPWNTFVVQYRYRKNVPTEVVVGKLSNQCYALENGLKIKLNLKANRNNGFFPDMVLGRQFICEHAKNKRVLNLFSYTCSLSVAALAGGADYVVNVDMSKSALSTGRENHRLNEQDLSKVKFLPYNILKSWNGIKKNGPFDLVIIDPPSFQKGSFVATKDYQKIISRLTQFLAPGATVLSALNDPNLKPEYLINLFAEFAPELTFIERLPNSSQFPSVDEDRSLKNLVFQYKL